MPGAAKQITPEAPAGGVDFGEYVQFSMRETDDGRLVAVVDNDILKDIYDGRWTREKGKQARKAAKEALKKYKRVYVNNVETSVNSDTRNEYSGSDYTYEIWKRNKRAFADKMRFADVIDDVVSATVGWKNDGSLTHRRTDNFVDFVKDDVLLASDDKKYSARVVVGVTKSGNYVLYDITSMEPTDFSYKNADLPPRYIRNNPRQRVSGASTNEIIVPSEDFVKQYQQRDEQISIRELLANVIEDASTSADEMAWLKGYRKDLKELDKKLDAISQNKQIIRELMFKKGRTSEESQRLSKARERLKILNEQVVRMDEGLKRDYRIDSVFLTALFECLRMYSMVSANTRVINNQQRHLYQMVQTPSG